MDDARPRRDDPQIVERPLRPAQEEVPLAVAHVLLLDVEPEGGRGAERVDLNGVIDDQIGRHDGIHPPRIAAHGLNGAAHRREIDHDGHAGEVLE